MVVPASLLVIVTSYKISTQPVHVHVHAQGIRSKMAVIFQFRLYVYNVRPVVYLDFFLILGFFTNLPLPETFLERREVGTKVRKK